MSPRSENTQNHTCGASKDEKRETSSFSRRTFLKGMAATGAGVVAATSLAGCKNAASPDGTSALAPVVVDESSGTSVTDAFTYTDSMAQLTQVGEWTLPLGAIPRPASGNWIPVLLPATLASSVVQAAAFSLASATLVPLFTQPISQAMQYELFELAGSDSLMCWVELEMNTRSWNLYAQTFANGALAGTPQLLMSKDGSWEPPHPVVSGTTVVWQVLPTMAGPHSKEKSVAYVWDGKGEPRSFLESSGKFATTPFLANNICTLTPRAEGTNQVFYALANYDLTTFSAKEQLLLPQSIKPFSASWIQNQFVFQIAATYATGGLLAKMGTYITEDNNAFTYIAREPIAPVAYAKGVYIVKNQASCIEVDKASATYSVLAAANRSVAWGEFPLRTGEASDFLTFACVKNYDTGMSEAVKLRRFA